MKKTVCFSLLFLLTSLTCLAQEKNITLDYAVTYVIENNRKANDTLTIGLDKEGKFLWTDYKKIGMNFAKEIFINRTNLTEENTEANIIFETGTGDIYFAFKGGENLLYLKMNIGDVVPSSSDEPLDENINLISNKTENTVKINNGEHNEYEIYAESEPNSKIIAVFDESLSFNSNNLFKAFIEIMLRTSNSNGSIDYNLPNGVILKISESNKTIIEALDIKKVSKTINMNYTFEVKD